MVGRGYLTTWGSPAARLSPVTMKEFFMLQLSAEQHGVRPGTDYVCISLAAFRDGEMIELDVKSDFHMCRGGDARRMLHFLMS